MKYLILLILSFNSYSETKFVMTDLRNNSKQGEDTFSTAKEAKDKLVEIAKIKKSWRKGEFNNTPQGSLYSKVINGVTKYYHPTNWSYALSDATQEVADKKALRAARKAKRQALKGSKMDKRPAESVADWRLRVSNTIEEILKTLGD